MKEFVWALSLGFCGALASLLTHGWNASAVDQVDRQQYARLLSSRASESITQRADRQSVLLGKAIVSRFSVDGMIERSDRSIERPSGSRSADVALWIRPSLRRIYLLLGMAPILVLLIGASVLAGLALRESSLDHMAWRSPTLAYVAKKFAFIVGGGGIVFFILSPAVLPLWLVYVFASPLCGGLVLYVGSLGRI
jgi:hypothetical protein